MRYGMVVSGIVLLGVAALVAFGKDDPPSVADVDAPLARGGSLKATVHRPAKGNGCAVVLAPGGGYHKELPILKRSAEMLADAGFVAIRFDWAYFTAKKQPSDDLSTEVADVDSMVAFAKKQEGVTKTLLVGKSLGSEATLAWSLQHEDQVAGLALLTFPTTPDANPSAADLAKSDLAPLVVCGDHDPMVDLAALYSIAAKAQHPPRIVIVPGDHGFTNGDKASADTAENVELAARNLVVWAKRRLAEK